MTIIQERWEVIQKLPLKYGGHKPDSQFCVMEAAAYVAGEKWSDHPACVPPTIAALLRRWNDRLPTDADRDRLLKPFIPKIIGLPSDKNTELRRAVMCGDWALRVLIPEYLRYAKRDKLADALAARVESATQAELREAVRFVQGKLGASASAIDIDIDIDIAIIDIDIDIAIAKRLEESQSALVERMIECRIEDE